MEREQSTYKRMLAGEHATTIDNNMKNMQSIHNIIRM
jgi:hypothetical protein